MEFGREMIDQVFQDTDIHVRVGSRLYTSQETVLNYLVLARSAESDNLTIRWDGAVRISPRMTIAADEHASFNMGDLFGEDEDVPPVMQNLAIVFRSAYLHLDKGVQRQHVSQSLDEAIGSVKNLFDRITSHRSRELGNQNNALIIAPSEFAWPVSVMKYVSEVVGKDFRSFQKYNP